MSIYPLSAPTQSGGTATTVTRLPPPFALTHIDMGCGRDGLHMDRINKSDALMALWPWMREGLRYIAYKNGRYAQWLPEHVLSEISKGLIGQNSCEAFIAHDVATQQAMGFLVAFPHVDPFVNLPLTWHVWMATIRPKVLMHVFEEFENLARARGYVRWQWGSSRKGWERRAALFGASVVERTIGKDL